MGTLRPVAEPTPVELSFRASMSADLINKVIDDEGMQPSDEWELTFDLKEVESSDLRRRLREAHDRYLAVAPYPVLNRLEEDPAGFLEDLEPWLKEAEKEKVEIEAAAAMATEEESAIMAVFLQDMKSWVAANGSERLKLAAEGGYRINTSYALERSRQEMPGFWVDSAEDCEWGERADPTEEALLAERALKAHLEKIDPSLETRIVWLTETPRALDNKMEAEGVEFEAQEALVVQGYLGRYLLVMPLEILLRRDSSEEY